MKKRSLITLILASMAIGALVGCTGSNTKSESQAPQSSSGGSSGGQSSSGQDELPAEYNLLKYWSGNPSEEFYDVNDTGANTIITYTDLTGEENGGWAYVARPFAYDSANLARFSEYKKFSFTAKLEKTSGSDIVMIKAEGAQIFEKRIQITEEEQTFEFSTAFISDWQGMVSLLFFANRNIKESGNGVLTLTRFCLSKEEVNPAYDISGAMPDVPQDWNYYDGEEKLNVMYSWGYNAQGEIATEKVDGGYKFTWGGDVKKTEAWGFVSAKIKNLHDDKPFKDSGYKRIVFTVQGTEGQKAILKFEARVCPTTVKAQKEVTVELTGEAQTVEIDVTGVVPNAEADGYFPLIMPAAGETGMIAAGELTLSECYLDKTAVVVPEEKNDPYFPVIWMDKVAVKDPCYTTFTDGHTLTVQYAKQAAGYESMQLKVADSDEWFVKDEHVKAYRRVVGIVKADVNVKVLLKPYDDNANEHWLTLAAGVEQKVDFTVAEDKADLTKPFVLFVCAGDGEQAMSGTVTFEGLRLSRENVNIGYKDDIKLDKVYNAHNEYNYTIEDGNLVSNFAFKKVDWHMTEMYISAEDVAQYNELVGTITSTVATTLVLKPADNAANELKVALAAGVPYELDHKFTGKFDYNWSKFVFFLSMEEGDALEGKITFANFAFKVNDPYKISTDPNPVSLGSVYLDNWCFASDCYSLRKAPNGTEVTFEGKGEGWENMQASLAKMEDWFNLADYNRVTATLLSTVDMHVILKPYDNGACEKGYDLVANQPLMVDYTFDSNADGIDFAKNFIFFVGTGGCAAGELTISRLAMSNPKTNLEAEDGNIYLTQPFFALEGTYAVTSGDRGMVINYNKPAGQEWEGIQIYASARDLDAYKVLHYELTSVKAVHVKFKIDGPNEEKDIEVPVGESSGTLTFTNHIDAKWNKILIFIAYDAGDDLAGSLNFSKLYFAAE